MVTRRIRWSLLVLALLLLVLIGVRTVEAKTPSDCSEANLNGTYGVLEQGTVVGQLPGFPPPPWRFANSVIAVYDGAGNFSGTFTASAAGGIGMGAFAGTYTVKPDCTYSDEFTPAPGIVLHHAGTITGSGVFREIHYVYSDAGTVISGMAKKTPEGGCSQASLTGTYCWDGRGQVCCAVSWLSSTAGAFCWQHDSCLRWRRELFR